jgi:hypothetical protein
VDVESHISGRGGLIGDMFWLATAGYAVLVEDARMGFGLAGLGRVEEYL